MMEVEPSSETEPPIVVIDCTGDEETAAGTSQQDLDKDMDIDESVLKELQEDLNEGQQNISGPDIQDISKEIIDITDDNALPDASELTEVTDSPVTATVGLESAIVEPEGQVTETTKKDQVAMASAIKDAELNKMLMKEISENIVVTNRLVPSSDPQKGSQMVPVMSIKAGVKNLILTQAELKILIDCDAMKVVSDPNVSKSAPPKLIMNMKKVKAILSKPKLNLIMKKIEEQKSKPLPLLPKPVSSEKPKKPFEFPKPKAQPSKLNMGRQLKPTSSPKSSKRQDPLLKNANKANLLNLKFLRRKLFMNVADKKVMTSYLQLEKSYLRLKSVAQKRQKKLNKLKNLYKNVVSRIGTLCNSLTFASENIVALNALNSAVKQENNRWSFEERIKSLAMYKKSPASYKMFRVVFNLLSEKALKLSLEKHTTRACMNKYVSSLVKEFVAKLTPKDRICCLSFDEIELKVHTQFDNKYDRIQGLCDMGQLKGRTKECGDHVVVFELKGLQDNWSLPICYFFTKGAIKPDVLKRHITRLLNDCQEMGLTVMCTSCPMRENFVKTMELFDSCKERPFIENKDQWVMTIYDPAHLLMMFREQLYRGNIEMSLFIDDEPEVQMASWSHVVRAYELDAQNAFPKLNKIKPKDLELPTSKISIKQAASVLSNSVASTINQLVVSGVFDRSMLATAHFTGKINETFDSLNGKSVKPKGANGLRCRIQVDREQTHMDFWVEAAREIESWNFHGDCLAQNGWTTTLRSLLILWSKLRNMGCSSFELRRLSNDSLRSMFAGMQKFYKRRGLITFYQFERAFSNCVINHLIAMQTNNGKMEKIDKSKVFDCPMGNSSGTAEGPKNTEKVFKLIGHKVTKHFKECFSLRYLTEVILVELKKKVVCSKCRSGIFSSSNIFADTGFEFKDGSSTLIPSQQLVRSIGLSVVEYEKAMPKNMLKDRISFIMPETLLKTFDNEWLKSACNAHFKNVTKLIISVIYEIVSQWWAEKLCTDRDQIIYQEIKNRKVTRGPNRTPTKIQAKVTTPRSTNFPKKKKKLPPVPASQIIHMPDIDDHRIPHEEMFERNFQRELESLLDKSLSPKTFDSVHN